MRRGLEVPAAHLTRDIGVEAEVALLRDIQFTRPADIDPCEQPAHIEPAPVVAAIDIEDIHARVDAPKVEAGMARVGAGAEREFPNALVLQSGHLGRISKRGLKTVLPAASDSLFR